MSDSANQRSKQLAIPDADSSSSSNSSSSNSRVAISISSSADAASISSSSADTTKDTIKDPLKISAAQSSISTTKFALRAAAAMVVRLVPPIAALGVFAQQCALSLEGLQVWLTIDSVFFAVAFAVLLIVHKRTQNGRRGAFTFACVVSMLLHAAILVSGATIVNRSGQTSTNGAGGALELCAASYHDLLRQCAVYALTVDAVVCTGVIAILIMEFRKPSI